MPVKVHREDIDDTHVALTIDIGQDMLDRAIASAFQRVAKRTSIPGFRPGKAPRHLLERVIDREQVRERAVDQVMQDGFHEALQETGIEPCPGVDPRVEMADDTEDGLRLRATVALSPSVELGSLEGLTARRVRTPVTDEQVEAALEEVRQKRATWEPKEAPSAEGDRIRCTMQFTVNGAVDTETSFSTPQLLQIGGSIPELDENLTGLRAGEEKQFSMTYPEDFGDPALAGKTADVMVRVVEVLERVIPPADDALAALGGYASLDEMREHIRLQLQTQSDLIAEQSVNDSLIEQVVRRSTFRIPAEKVDDDARERMARLLATLEQREHTLGDYLAARKIELPELDAELRNRAEEQLKLVMTLRELGVALDIHVSDADVEEEMRARAERAEVKLGEYRRIVGEAGKTGDLMSEIFIRKLAVALRERAEIRDIT